MSTFDRVMTVAWWVIFMIGLLNHEAFLVAGAGTMLILDKIEASR